MILVGKASGLGGSIELVRRGQRAVAVVGDGGHDGVGRAIIGDALVQAERVGASLAQRVRVRAGRLVADRAQCDGTVGVVGAARDDHAVLEQFKRELASCKVASGQALDRLDLVGHHRIDGCHAVSVGEREGRTVVALAHDAQMSGAVISHGVGNLTRGVGVIGHARGATGLGHRVGKGVRARSSGGRLVLVLGFISVNVNVGLVGLCLVGLRLVGLCLISVGFIGFGLVGRVVRHAQGAVEVLERKVDLAKVHVAGRVVGCGRVLGHRGARLVGGHGEGELTRDVGRGQALSGLELLGAGERGINGIGAVDVLEQGLNAVVDGRCRQGTVAVIDDNDLKAKARRCGRDALGCELRRELKGGVTDGPCKLGILIGADSALGVYQVGEHLGGVMQGTETYMPINVGSACTLNGFLLTCVGDAKVELAVGHRATGQGLGGNDLSSGTTSRSAIAVDERDHGALDRSAAGLVLGHQRALRAAGDGCGGGNRAGTVVGNGDRHGAHGVVIGVTGLAVVLLGHGVLEGLAGICLRKLDLMAGQDVDQADRCLCRRRRLEYVGALVQAKCAGRSLVGRRHGKGELALGHGTSGKGLAEFEAAGRGVIELRTIRVGKASVFLLGDAGDQLALAVLGHGHFGGRDMGVIRHADRAARVLADFVLVGSGSRVANLAELDGGDAVLRVALAHGYGCRIGQRGAIGGGDSKAELVPIRPLATVDGLAQAKVEVCIGRGHVVGVLEGRRLVALQDMLGLEGAVTVVRDGGLDGVLGIAVGNALADGSALGLAQRVGVLPGLGVLDGVHRDLAVGGVLTGGNNRGVLALALDELKAKLAVLEVAPGQALGRGDFVGDARLDRRHAIGIGEREGRVAVRLAGNLQIALAVIGHGEGNSARRLSVVSHASHLAGLGHGVGKGVLALLGLLAQSIVKVIERKVDLAKVDLAGRVVGCGRALGHRGAGLVGSHGKGELVSDIGRSQAFGDLQVLDARKRFLGVIRGVRVLELDALDVLVAL